MVRSEWWARCEDPSNMVGVAGVSDRKGRLFAAACCRRIPGLRRRRECLAAVEAAERYADGLCTWEEMSKANGGLRPGRTWQVEAAVHCSTYREAAEAAEYTSYSVAEGLAGGKGVGAQLRVHADLLREIVGDPYRPVPFDPAWRTGTVVSLARGMYEARDFAAMPILADAVQDAGCDNNDVLAHRRDPRGGPRPRVLGGRPRPGEGMTVRCRRR